jgi:serine/threonine protein kinase
VHVLARGLLGALEHAHSRSVIIRRILPSSLIVGPSGRGTLTDLRHSSFTLPFIPPHERNTGLAFMAPEVRAGRTGDAASDVYTAAAILYYALTGQEPASDPAEIIPPTELRPAGPAGVRPADGAGHAARSLGPLHHRVGDVRGLRLGSRRRREPGTYIGSPATDTLFESAEHWEKRMRRALGDDYELLAELGRAGSAGLPGARPAPRAHRRAQGAGAGPDP